MPKPSERIYDVIDRAHAKDRSAIPSTVDAIIEVLDELDERLRKVEARRYAYCGFCGRLPDTGEHKEDCTSFHGEQQRRISKWQTTGDSVPKDDDKPIFDIS